eukprot:gene14398-17027_t
MEPSSDSHTSNVGSHFMEKLTVDAIEQAVTPLAYELLKKLQEQLWLWYVLQPHYLKAQPSSVDLDRDVNQYLAKGLQVDNIFPAPMAAKILAATHLPRKVRVSPPGTLYRDSEYNYLLVPLYPGAYCLCRTLEMFTESCSEIYASYGELADREASSNTSPQSSARRPKAYSVTEVMHRKVERMLISSAASPPHLTPVTGLSATPTEMSRLLLACLQAADAGSGLIQAADAGSGLIQAADAGSGLIQ